MDKIKEMLKNKKVLTGAVAGLAVVVILIIIIAVSCGKNDNAGKGTSGTSKTESATTTVKKAEKDTADEQNTTESDTELSETETSTAEDSTEVSTEETTEQPTVEETTEEQTTEEQTTEAPTPQPTQEPTEAPTTTQEQTTVPAGYSPTAKFPYDETVKELHDTYGYPYPTVDYSTLPVQDFSQYFFDPEATGVQNNYFGENSKYITRIIYNPDSVTTYQFDLYNPEEDNFLITFPKEIPLYTLVNWNGKIGYFCREGVTVKDKNLYTTDFCYPYKEYVEGIGEVKTTSFGYIGFGTNLTWDDCPDGQYLFVYIREPK